MPLDLHRVRALCFDVDGTLSDTDDQWVQRMENALQPVRFLFGRRELRHVVRRLVMGMETPGNRIYHWLDHLHLDDDVAKVAGKFTAQRARHAGGFWIIPHVKESLLRLAPHYPLAVVSARDQHTTLDFLDQFELTHLFKTVVTAQTCEYTKPYPHPVEYAARQMGVSPRDCLMIGDTVVDIRAGKAAGAQTVGVLCGFGEENELRQAGADLILPSTAHLAEILLPEGAPEG